MVFMVIVFSAIVLFSLFYSSNVTVYEYKSLAIPANIITTTMLLDGGIKTTELLLLDNNATWITNGKLYLVNPSTISIDLRTATINSRAEKPLNSRVIPCSFLVSGTPGAITVSSVTFTFTTRELRVVSPGDAPMFLLVSLALVSLFFFLWCAVVMD